MDEEWDEWLKRLDAINEAQRDQEQADKRWPDMTEAEKAEVDLAERQWRTNQRVAI